MGSAPRPPKQPPHCEFLATRLFEDLLVQRFVEGLDEISFQRHLVMSTPQTMQEAVDVAEKLHSCDALEDRGKPKPVFEEPGSSSISNRELLRAIKDLRLELKSTEKPDRHTSSFPMPIRRGACYRCGENGYISGSALPKVLEQINLVKDSQTSSDWCQFGLLISRRITSGLGGQWF